MAEVDDYTYDDDGFSDYVSTTINPGSSILIATAIFCVSLYFFLPCIVSFLNRRKRAKTSAVGSPNTVIVDTRPLEDTPSGTATEVGSRFS